MRQQLASASAQEAQRELQQARTDAAAAATAQLQQHAREVEDTRRLRDAEDARLRQEVDALREQLGAAQEQVSEARGATSAVRSELVGARDELQASRQEVRVCLLACAHDMA